MKKLLGLVMVLGLVLVLGRVAMAADTNTVTVSANVVGTCKFSPEVQHLHLVTLILRQVRIRMQRYLNPHFGARKMQPIQ